MFKATFISLSMLLAFGIFSVSIGRTNGDHHSPDHPVNETCKGEHVNSKVFDVGFEECAKEVFPKSSTTPKPTDTKAVDKYWEKMFKEYGLCLEVCIGKKQGYINADGSYNKAGSEKLVKAAYPAKVQAALNKAFNECASANSKSLSTSNKCASYKGLFDCSHKKHFEICDIKE